MYRKEIADAISFFIYKQQLLDYKGHNKREVADDYIQFANYINGTNNIFEFFNVINGGK